VILFDPDDTILVAFGPSLNGPPLQA